MAAEEYLTFQRFNDKALAGDLINLLTENNIPFEFDETKSFDPTFTNSELAKDYRVKLRHQDFETANELLQKASENQIAQLDKDYYLFKFTDEELMEIVLRPDEWNQLDYVL